MRFLVINFKNYPEALGEGAVRLAEAAERAASVRGVRVMVAPPSTTVALIASRVSIPVFCQSLDVEEGEMTTGADTPEGAAAAGAKGAILNHSESRMPVSDLAALVPRAKRVGLEVCLCADGPRKAVQLSRFHPDYIAVEPPELIGTGVAVSRARPEVVTGSVRALAKAGFRGSVLCGAGIVTAEDARKATGLGADGVLVSSSIVKARDWERKIREIALSLI